MQFANAVQKRLADVDYAIGSQMLEGLTVSAETQANMRRMALGEITSEECLELIRQHHGLPRLK